MFIKACSSSIAKVTFSCYLFQSARKFFRIAGSPEKIWRLRESNSRPLGRKMTLLTTGPPKRPNTYFFKWVSQQMYSVPGSLGFAIPCKWSCTKLWTSQLFAIYLFFFLSETGFQVHPKKVSQSVVESFSSFAMSLYFDRSKTHHPECLIWQKLFLD